MGLKKIPEPIFQGSKPLTQVVPIVFLKYRARKVAGAHPEAEDDMPFPLLNELVQPWELTFTSDKDTLILSWAPFQRHPGERWFDDKKAYIVPQMIDIALFNRLADAQAGNKLKITITLKVQFYELFRRFLEGLRADTPDLATFGGPIEPGKLSSTQEEILKLLKKEKGGYALTKDAFEAQNLPCDVEDSVFSIMFTKGAPTLKLDVYIRAKEELAPEKVDDFATAMVAADWSALYGADTTDPVVGNREDSRNTWSKNIQIYLANYTQLDRGKKILDQVIASAKALASTGAATQEIVKHVRDEIDKRLITANAWSDPRESPTKEKYQYELMRFFGSMLKDKSSPRIEAAPIQRFRLLAQTIPYSLEQRAQFALQSGVGHCGEHAHVSYVVLGQLSQKFQRLLPVVYSGEVNVDHALVIVGVFPSSIRRAKFKKDNPHRDALNPDAALFVWDLEEALKAALPGDDGSVCDPYLEKYLPSARTLLKAVKRKKTTFVLMRLIEDGGTEVPIDVLPEIEI